MMDLCDLAPPYIRAIAPYQPGKPISELERELGLKDIVKLASNETRWAPVPRRSLRYARRYLKSRVIPTAMVSH